MREAHELEEALGISFMDKSLLKQALTHRSYTNENPGWEVPPNERLEFLGDAVLDFLTADYLYRHFPDMQEGEMTALRAALVNTESLARLAESWRLGEYLFLGRGEEASGGRTRLPNLCAALEALIGALYLDQGMDAVRQIMAPAIAERVAALLRSQVRAAVSLVRDAKSRLQELAQSRYHLTPVYQTVAERGPDHEKEFTVEVWIGDTVWGRGVGRSKQAAEQAAAKEAIAALEGDLSA